jgi:hypothetical protein
VTVRVQGGATQDELIEMVRAVQAENKIPESHIAALVSGAPSHYLLAKARARARVCVCVFSHA